MATYYPSSSNQKDVLPTPYSSNQELDSYHGSARLSDNMMFPNQASTTVAYSELLSGSSLSPNNCVEFPSVGGRDELVFIPPTGDPVSAQQIGRQPTMTTGVQVDDSVTGEPHMLSRTMHHSLDGERNLQYQRLSLSLGMQTPSSIHLPSFQYHYTNPGPSYFLSSHVPDSGEHGSQSKELKNAEYVSFALAGGAQNMTKIGVLNKEMQYDPHLYEPSGLVCTIFNSKYLKAAQQLLDEAVNVHEALKQPKSDKHHKFHKLGSDGSEETDLKYQSMDGMSSDPHESTTHSSGELSPAERQDLQSKMTKLFSMLDEVDRIYKQYSHQMQTVESSFEMVAGCGAAKPYTTLALQTISRHFRCLRNAINSQIQVLRQSLGEQDDTPNSQALPRLRYVDKQLRQQKTFQQLGIMRHSWRPQRGLPESSVSILRAWLFEHFLQPYPKDSEKIMLARQTGLTRSQVANWFINARVRLWKPMVEDMYKEEFGDSEADCKSSPEPAPKAARDKSWALEERGEELWGSLTSAAADAGHMGQFSDLKPDRLLNVEMKGCRARLDFQNGAHVDNNIDCGVMNLQGDQRPKVEDRGECPEEIITTNQTGDGSLIAAAAAYDISVLGDFAVGNQVSLALGLQHSEKDPLPLSGGTHSGFFCGA